MLQRKQCASSPSTCQISLCTDHTGAKNLDEIISIERNFQSIDVHLNSATVTHELTLVTYYHGSQLRTLRIKCEDAKWFLDFNNIFDNLPMLEELIITKSVDCLRQWESPPQLIFLLSRLKVFEISDEDLSILELIVAPQLRNLTVNSRRMESFYLNNLLNNSILLNTLSLKIEKHVPSDIFSSALHNLKLRKFHFSINVGPFECHTMDEELEGGFIEFLESQALTLQELQAEGFKLKQVLFTICNALKCLQTLYIGSETLYYKRRIYEQLEPSLSLKEIIFGKDYWLSKNEFLKKCPELETLKVCLIKPVTIDSLVSIQASNPNIKSLSITSFDSYIRTEIRFQFLRDLEITEVNNTNFLHSILRMNPGIENVTLNIYEYHPEGVFDDAKLCERIFDDRFFNILTYHPGVRQCKVITKFTISSAETLQSRTLDLTYKIFGFFKYKLEQRQSIDISMHSYNESFVLLKFPEKISYNKPKTSGISKKISLLNLNKIRKIFNRSQEKNA